MAGLKNLCAVQSCVVVLITYQMQTFRHLHSPRSSVHHLAEHPSLPPVSSESRANVDKEAWAKGCALVRRYTITILP